jgi:hypothetical protein
MKNRIRLYGKCIVPVVIFGIFCCISAVWAAQQQPGQETNPIATTKTDVWIYEFRVSGCHLGNDGYEAYEGDQIRFGGNIRMCGCWNRPLWVKYEVDGQLLKEWLMPFFQKYPSETACYKSGVCPEAPEYTDTATWVALPGTHTLKFSLDSKGEIYEIDELNNSKSVTVTVKHRPLQLPETKPKTPIKIPVPNSPAGSQLR